MMSGVFRIQLYVLLFSVSSMVAACNLGGEEEPLETPQDPPAVQILAGPDDTTAETSAEFVFQCDSDSSCEFECSLDGAPAVSCTSPQVYDNLEPGSHVFQVVAFDDQDQASSPAIWNWTIDTEDALIVDLEGPAELTNEQSATFDFGCSQDNCTFECSLNDEDFQSCSPPVSYDGLDDGDHVFAARAIDAQGTTGPPAEWTWTIDTESVYISNLTGPDDPTNETSADFDFDCSEPGCTFSCQLSAISQGVVESSTSCESGHSYSNLDDDTYTFSVTPFSSTGSEGIVDVWSWTVDTVAPQIELVDSPPERVYDDSITVEFECEGSAECTFNCALDHEDWDGSTDQGSWESCSSPHSTTALAAGHYTLHIEATDLAGNTAEEHVEWTVPEDDWMVISSNYDHSCGIRADDTLWCWGENEDGQLGLDDTNNRYAPFQIGSDHDWAQLAVGGWHTCGIRHDGSLWCWGSGGLGQLGHDDTDNRYVPTQVGNDYDWVKISAGVYHTCGLRADDTVWCWGSNHDAQLGIGDQTSLKESPTQVGSSNDWLEISAGDYHTCALRQNDTLYCWGRNSHGQLGVGTFSGYDFSPTQVGSDNDWAAIFAGAHHSCAMRTDDTLWCWGKNEDGQLGLNDTENRNEPTQVENNQWTTASAGGHHTCGIRPDDTLWCWGRNEYGQLGLGHESDRFQPSRVGDDDDWIDILSVGHHTCGLRTDGTLWCWGAGDYGRLGLGDEQDRNAPTRVQ